MTVPSTPLTLVTLSTVSLSSPLLLVLGLEFSVTEFSHTLRRHVPSGLVDLVLNATPGAVAGWLLGLDLTGVVALAGKM